MAVGRIQTEADLIAFVRRELGLPDNLRGLLATGSKTAPTMLHGWTNYHSSVFYWRDGFGYGHVAGEVIDNGGATVAAGTVLFSLPFAPPERVFQAVADNAGAVKVAEVTSSGDVKIGEDGPAFTAGNKVNLGHLVFPTF